MNAEEMAREIAEIDSRSKSNVHRLDRMEKRQDDLDRLVASVSVMAEKQDRMESDIGEIKGDIKGLVEKPARKWEAVAEKVLIGLIMAAIGFILAEIGLG